MTELENQNTIANIENHLSTNSSMSEHDYDASQIKVLE
jgi:hypothetical protein